MVQRYDKLPRNARGGRLRRLKGFRKLRRFRAFRALRCFSITVSRSGRGCLVLKNITVPFGRRDGK
jgi:hypothetical protein